MAAEPPKTPLPDEFVELIDLGPEEVAAAMPPTAAGPQRFVPRSPQAQTNPPLGREADAVDLETLLGLGPRAVSPSANPGPSISSSNFSILERAESASASDLQKAAANASNKLSAAHIQPADEALPTIDADALQIDSAGNFGDSPDDSQDSLQDSGFSERTLTTDTSVLQAASRLGGQQNAVPAASSRGPQTPAQTLQAGAASTLQTTLLKRRLWLGAAGLSVIVSAGAAMWWRRDLPSIATPSATEPIGIAPTTGPAGPAGELRQAPMKRADPPPPPQPHLMLVPTLTEVLPAPKATPLTLHNVDSLDYFSLQTGIQTLAAQADANLWGLRLWALFRMAQAFEDRRAQTSLAQALKKRTGRLSFLGQLAQIGHNALGGHPETSLVALRGLNRAATQLPQALWLSLWASDRAKGAEFVPNPKQLKTLQHLALGPLAAPDAQVLLAQWWLRADVQKAGLVAGWAQAAQKRDDADTQARLLEVLVAAEAWPVLDTALGSPDVDLAAGTRLALVQAAPAHQDLLWRLRVHRQVRLGDFVTAVHLAEQRAQAAPEHAEAQAEWQRLAQYLQPKTTEVAGEAQKAAKTTEPSDPASDMMQASRQLFEAIAQGDHDAAASPIVKMMALSASLPAPWAQLAKAEQQGRWKDAAHALDGLLWRDPTIGDPVDDMLQLIELTHRGGDCDRAVCEAQALVKSLPQDDRPPLLLAQMAHDAHHLEDQVHWLSTVVKRHPSARAPNLALATALTDAERAPEALEVLSHLKSLDAAAQDTEFLYVQARALGHTNPVAACTLLAAAARVKPQTKTYVLLSEIQQARGQLDAAGEAMRQAIAAAPEQWALRVKLARLLMPRRGYKEAAELLRQVLDQQPDAVEAAELLGDVLCEQGEPAAAAEIYSKASYGPKPSANLLLKLALVQLHELRDLAAAEKTLRHAILTEPEMPEPYYYLGLVLHDRNADAEAKKQLHIYLRLSPDGAFVTDAKEAMQGL